MESINVIVDDPNIDKRVEDDDDDLPFHTQYLIV